MLGLLATFLGMVIFTAPETVAQILKLQLPGILATQPGLLVSVGKCELTGLPCIWPR